MVGSEGTLGIVVEATLSFVPIPEFRCMGITNFNTLKDAGDAISSIMASGAIPSMLELVDDVAIKAVNKTMSLGLKEVAAALIFEADGMVKEAVDYEINKMKAICQKHNGEDIYASYDPKERDKIFLGRKSLFPALSKYDDNLASTALADDMAVPYSKMAEMAGKIHEIADKHHIVMTAYGHCGSGCMHTKILMDRCQALWVKKYWIERQSPAEPRPKQKKGLFISVGATTGKKLFDGALLTVRYFLDPLDAELWRSLLYRGLDGKEEVRAHPEYLDEAFNAGVDLCNATSRPGLP